MFEVGCLSSEHGPAPCRGRACGLVWRAGTHLLSELAIVVVAHDPPRTLHPAHNGGEGSGKAAQEEIRCKVT